MLRCCCVVVALCYVGWLVGALRCVALYRDIFRFVSFQCFASLRCVGSLALRCIMIFFILFYFCCVVLCCVSLRFNVLCCVDCLVLRCIVIFFVSFRFVVLCCVSLCCVVS